MSTQISMHTCHERWLATTLRPSSTPMDCGTCTLAFADGRHAGDCPFVITRLGSYILDLAVDVRQQRCQNQHISGYTRAVTSCAPIFPQKGRVAGFGTRLPMLTGQAPIRDGNLMLHQQHTSSAHTVRGGSSVEVREAQRGATQTPPHLQRQNRAHET